MNHNLKGTGIELTPELRSYVEKKLAGADKFVSDDPTAHADVELEYRELRHGDHYRAAFTVFLSGATYRAEAWGETLHNAVDLVSAELTRELRRTKRKRLHLLRHSAVKVKEYLRGWRGKV